MRYQLAFACFILITSFAACKEENADQVAAEGINKEGAIETQISVQHLDDSRDIIVTSHKVWKAKKQENLIVHYDTVPSLGKFIPKNSDGTTVPNAPMVPKEYELYITVK